MKLMPGEVTLDQLELLWRGQEAAALDPTVKPAVDAAAQTVAQAAAHHARTGQACA